MTELSVSYLALPMPSDRPFVHLALPTHPSHSCKKKKKKTTKNNKSIASRDPLPSEHAMMTQSLLIIRFLDNLCFG